MNTIVSPGLYPDVSCKDYHADPCASVSLNSTIAKILVNQSPKHAWLKHPRLGGAKPDGNEDDPKEEKVSKEKLLGSLLHRLMLGRGGDVVICDFKDWRTNAAKDMRQAALTAGHIPTLPRGYEEAKVAHTEARRQLDDLGLQRVFREGQQEVTVIWREGEFFFRAMMDNLIIDEANKTAEIWDLKTVSRSSHPQACAAQINSLGYDLSAAFYKQGLQSVRPDLRQIKFRWVFQEVNAPFAVTPVEIDGQWETIAVSQYCRAVDGWKRCLKADKWPMYTDQVIRLEPKPWMLMGEIGADQVAANVA